MKGRRGFTLIELLVVIAIVAILAAILFPVFLSAKRNGQASSCLNNVKQLSMASVLYADNHDGVLVPCLFYPEPVSSPTFYETAKLWRGLLAPYVRGRDAFICPALKKHAGCWFAWPSDTAGTYALNQSVTGWYWTPYCVKYRSSEYRKPSKIIILNEVYNRPAGGAGPIDAGFSLVANPLVLASNIMTYAPYVHNDKITIGFMDGHAKTMYLVDTLGERPHECLWIQYDKIGWSAGSTAQWQREAHRACRSRTRHIRTSATGSRRRRSVRERTIGAG